MLSPIIANKSSNKINSKFKIYYFRKYETYSLFFLITVKIVLSQFSFQLTIQFKIFIHKFSLNNPLLITVNEYMNINLLEYSPLIDGSFKKEISDLDDLNHANFFTKLVGRELYIISMSRTSF